MVPQESLAQTAIRCLNQAATHPADGSRTAPRYAAGNVGQPDSWLLNKCWQCLADAGYATETYSVAALAEIRQPLAPIKSLHRLAQQAYRSPPISSLVQSELAHARERVFGNLLFAESSDQIDYVLYAAASAAFIGETLFAISCLERLDQIPKSWDRVFVQPHLRQILADTVALSALTPLTNYLIDKALLYFGDSGAQFLQQVASSTQSLNGATDAAARHPILMRCVMALRRAVLGSLHSRKVAASILAQAGEVDDVLEQIRTIAMIQDAHRETNALLDRRGGNASTASDEPIQIRTSSVYNDTVPINNRTANGGTGNGSGHETNTSYQPGATTRDTKTLNDTVQIVEMATASAAERSRSFPVYRSSLSEHNSSVIRQISRTSADTDVDFLVYTLKGAIETLPLSELSEEKRRTLINQLAALGMMSDGWTAAGATSALLMLGGVEEALRVVHQIDSGDPTRIEGVLALVNGLLDLDEAGLAQTETKKALAWADKLPERSPIRTLRRGIANAYIEHNRPEIALSILEEEIPQESGWRHNLGRFMSGRLFQEEMSDERLHTEQLRLAASLNALMNQMTEARQAVASQTQFNQAGASHSLDGKLIQLPADSDLPPELDKLVRRLSGWAPAFLDGEALVTFYHDSLLIPLIKVGQMRYAWGLLPQLEEALLGLQSNKMPLRVAQVCQPLSALLVSLARDDESGQVETMTGYLMKFMVDLWSTCATRGTWATIYAIDGCLSAIVALFGPEPIIEIAQATVEQGALWEV